MVVQRMLLANRKTFNCKDTDSQISSIDSPQDEVPDRKEQISICIGNKLGRKVNLDEYLGHRDLQGGEFMSGPTLRHWRLSWSPPDPL